MIIRQDILEIEIQKIKTNGVYVSPFLSHIFQFNEMNEDTLEQFNKSVNRITLSFKDKEIDQLWSFFSPKINPGHVGSEEPRVKYSI